MTDRLKATGLLDIDTAIGNMGDADTYVNTVSDFYVTASKRYDMIQNYYEARDIKNYTIQVHGLKSTSRLIGQMSLSEKAKALEAAGDAGDFDTIEADTPALLAEFKELIEALSGIFGADEEDESLPLADAGMISEAVEVMKQGIDEFDFDMTESVMNQLKGYRLPEPFKTAYAKLKVCMAEVDYEGMMEILEEF